MTARSAADARRPARAVVFAYHSVGVRCLKVLLAGGVDVALVVTHDDAPGENIWFASVRQTADSYGIPVVVADDPNSEAFRQRVAALAPDFLFSFYYRQILGDRLLAIAPRGALNLHGSLLPRYRGRVPVNWAVLHGETRTGATLHYMVTKPDAGDIVAQSEVPILPDDTAGEVFDKVLVAAELTLWRALPGLLDGSAPRVPQDLSAGSYFGGRRPEDGRIDWTQPAQRIHDLIRAVAPPYPGAWSDLGGVRLQVFESRRLPADTTAGPDAPSLRFEDGRLIARCGDGRELWLRRARIAAGPDGDAPVDGDTPPDGDAPLDGDREPATAAGTSSGDIALTEPAAIARRLGLPRALT
ncbi:MAG: formyltransferase [Burkholderiaceae bacterium]